MPKGKTKAKWAKGRAMAKQLTKGADRKKEVVFRSLKMYPTAKFQLAIQAATKPGVCSKEKPKVSIS